MHNTKRPASRLLRADCEFGNFATQDLGPAILTREVYAISRQSAYIGLTNCHIYDSDSPEGNLILFEGALELDNVTMQSPTARNATATDTSSIMFSPGGELEFFIEQTGAWNASLPLEEAENLPGRLTSTDSFFSEAQEVCTLATCVCKCGALECESLRNTLMRKCIASYVVSASHGKLHVHAISDTPLRSGAYSALCRSTVLVVACVASTEDSVTAQ